MIKEISTTVNHTDKETEYLIEKWVCSLCEQEKSTCYIDGEWCHGDSQSAHFDSTGRVDGCSTCILKGGFSKYDEYN